MTACRRVAGKESSSPGLRNGDLLLRLRAKASVAVWGHIVVQGSLLPRRSPLGYPKQRWFFIFGFTGVVMPPRLPAEAEAFLATQAFFEPFVGAGGGVRRHLANWHIG